MKVSDVFLQNLILQKNNEKLVSKDTTHSSYNFWNPSIRTIMLPYMLILSMYLSFSNWLGSFTSESTILQLQKNDVAFCSAFCYHFCSAPWMEPLWQPILLLLSMQSGKVVHVLFSWMIHRRWSICNLTQFERYFIGSMFTGLFSSGEILTINDHYYQYIPFNIEIMTHSQKTMSIL